MTLIIIGSTIFLLALFMLFRNYQLIRNGHRSCALVIRLEEVEVTRNGELRKKTFPIITYQNSEGLPVFSKVESGDKNFRVGDEVNIIYSSNNPEHVTLDQPWFLRMFYWFLLFIGLILNGLHVVLNTSLI